MKRNAVRRRPFGRLVAALLLVFSCTIPAFADLTGPDDNPPPPPPSRGVRVLARD